jgi:ADP-ribose pyrophosphatase YjhB (NUDIX family)
MVAQGCPAVSHMAGFCLVKPMISLVFRTSARLHLFYARHRRAITLGVRSAVFDGEGRVLLLRHTYAPGWHFPGGGVEPAESAAQAAARELHEECGIAETEPSEFFGLYLNRAHAARDHVAVFVTRQWWQARDPGIPNLEIRECRFFAVDALPGEASPATRRRLAEIIHGAPRSADW